MYDHLRAIAGKYLRRHPGHTLQPTALVNEAFLRLDTKESAAWESREHFLAVAARAMRYILVDHARRKGADKRGGGQKRVTVSGLVTDDTERLVDLLALDAALDGLAKLDPRHARVVELRFFGGLGTKEIAKVLEVGTATVERDWFKARAWLLVKLAASPPPTA